MSSDPAHLASGVRTAGLATRAETLRTLFGGPAHALAPIAIGALWALAITDVDLREMTDFGLVSVMPVGALLLLGLLTVSFCLVLRGRPLRPWVAVAHLAVLIVMLYGVTAFLESEPRFATVYRHVGIIDTIVRTGSADPGIDAYFSWPGFFALGGTITQAMGLDALTIAPWAPLAFNLLFLAPLVVIFRWASGDPRVVWLGLWVFYSANWVGQDYLSPQGLGFALWLAILAALLTCFAPPPLALVVRSAPRRLLELLDVRRTRERLRREARVAAVHTAPPRRAGMLVVLVAIFTAIVSGHQLTPFPIVLTVTALVLFAGVETRRLPILMGVILGAWISYRTTAYLAGHIGDLTKPLGSTSQNLTKNVSSRVTGSPDHTLIVQLRLFGTAVIWLLALAGAARRLAAGRVDIALIVVGAAPFVLPAVQPYGGEMMLRVFLFTLPAVAFFVACLAFPTRAAGRGSGTTAAITVACLALLGMFQFMRYGNERLDHFTAGDAAAVAALYRSAPLGATLIGSGNLPWRHRHYSDYEYTSLFKLDSWRVAAPDAGAIATELDRIVAERGTSVYVIVTRSMRVEAEMLNNKPGVLERLATTLSHRPNAIRLHHNPDGDVFLIASPLRMPGAAPAVPSESG